MSPKCAPELELATVNMSPKTGDCAARRPLYTLNMTLLETRMILPSSSHSSSSREAPSKESEFSLLPLVEGAPSSVRGRFGVLGLVVSIMVVMAEGRRQVVPRKASLTFMSREQRRVAL